MVCDRCIWFVQQELEKLGLTVLKIKLGEAELEDQEPFPDQAVLERVLRDKGFELLTDPKFVLVEKIKTLVIEQVHRPQGTALHGNFSQMIQEKIGMDYHYLSLIFSSKEGITIDKYIILRSEEHTYELQSLMRISY